MSFWIYARLVILTAGTLLPFFWIVVILGHRRQRNFERVLFFLCLALVFYFGASLLALNTWLYYPDKAVPLPFHVSSNKAEWLLHFWWILVWIGVFALSIGASAPGICARSRDSCSRHQKELLGCRRIPASYPIFSLVLRSAKASFKPRLCFAGERLGTAFSVMARGGYFAVLALAGRVCRNRARQGTKVVPSDLEV